MSKNKSFDCIVVGAGPAGCASALVLAREGLKVLLLERGEYPGSKNMFGGVLYHKVLHDLIPNFWDEAPVERFVTRRVLTFLTEESALSMDFKSGSFAQPPYNGFTVLRSKFDRWLAQKAEEAGAFLLCDCVADDLLWENDQVVGVKVKRDEGEVRARAVIAADGVNSLLAQRAGLRPELDPCDISLGVKEVLCLPKEVIEERFNLSGDEGLANEFIGFCTRGVQGGGFLYTNRASLSLGVVTNLASLINHKLKPSELIEEFKAHPIIRALIKGATTREYLAHLIPEGGLRMKPQRLSAPGLLIAGDAAGFVCATGLNLEGANMAIASGVIAGQTVLQAFQKGDFSAPAFAQYEERLKESFVLTDLMTYKNAPAFLDIPRLYQDYPQLACQMAQSIFTVNGQPKRRLLSLLKGHLKGRLSTWQLIKDAIKLGGSL